MLTLLLSTTLLLHAQLPLNGTRAFTCKDNTANAWPSANVPDWQTIQGNTPWRAKADLAEEGSIIWVRQTVVIPSALLRNKENAIALRITHRVGTQAYQVQSAPNGKCENIVWFRIAMPALTYNERMLVHCVLNSTQYSGLLKRPLTYNAAISTSSNRQMAIAKISH